MAQFEQHHVLRIFLASPSDLESERRLARQVVDAVNRAIGRRIGWHVELLGWEDTLPGFSRPQELINRDVDACHLFIGILWKRWGSATGGYSSGFEEEYELALGRQGSADSPEIWLFFKGVDSSLLSDPGVQLQQVLNFRDRIREARQVLYKEFGTSDEWAGQLQEYLSAHLLDIWGYVGQGVPQSPPLSSESAPTAAAESLPADAESLTLEQIQGVWQQVQVAIGANGERPEGLRIDEFAELRLLLLATSLSRTRARLSVHDANRAYRYRSQLSLMSWEFVTLVRGVLADSEDVVPGWFWLRGRKDVELARLLMGFAWRETDSNTLVGVYRLLKLISGPLGEQSDSMRRAFIHMALGEKASGVRSAVAEYLGDAASESDLPYVEEAVNEGLCPAQQGAAVISKVLWRVNPRRALERILENGTLRLAELPLRVDKNSIPAEMLRRALRHKRADVRSFAVRQLGHMRDLKPEEAIELAQDSSVSVIKALADAAQRFPAAARREVASYLVARLKDEKLESLGLRTSELGPRILELLSSADLRAHIDWYEVLAPEAYRTLGIKHFSSFGPQLRDDLANGFERLREDYRERFGRKLMEGSDLQSDPELPERIQQETERLLSDLAKHDQWIRDRFTVAALETLAKHGSRKDAALVRQFLDPGDTAVQLQAVLALAKTGDRTDIDKLIDIVLTETREDVQLAAIRSVRALGGGARARARLLGSDQPKVVLVALEEGWVRPPSRRQVRSLLHHRNADVRKAAVIWAIQLESRDELARLLDWYLGRETYYYNVVVWMDRALFAPPGLRRVFITQLRP